MSGLCGGGSELRQDQHRFRPRRCDVGRPAAHVRHGLARSKGQGRWWRAHPRRAHRLLERRHRSVRRYCHCGHHRRPQGASESCMTRPAATARPAADRARPSQGRRVRQPGNRDRTRRTITRHLAPSRHILRPAGRTPAGLRPGCDLEVEPARACNPYAPPAVFTGTGALYDRPTSALSTV